MKKLLICLGLVLSLGAFGQNTYKYPIHANGGIRVGTTGDTITLITNQGDTTLVFTLNDGTTITTGGSGGGSANYENALIVAKSGGQYTDINSAINAASSGNLIIVYPGTYDVDSIELKNGVDIIGLGNGTIIEKTANNHTEWVLLADNDTCNISNLVVKGANYLKAENNSLLKFRDVKFQRYDNTYYAGVIELYDSAKVYFTNVDLENGYHASYGAYPVKLLNVSELVWYGGTFTGGFIMLYDTSNAIINIDKLELANNSISTSFVLGEENSYNSAITGTSTSYKDKSDPNYNNWVSANEENMPSLHLSVLNCGDEQVSFLNYNKGRLYLNSTNSNRSATVIVNTYNSAVTEINNSIISKIGGDWGDYVVKLTNSKIIYDNDLSTSGDTSNVYDSSYWPSYSGGTHAIELSNFYNSELFPQLIMTNVEVEYMGDDVLNSLTEAQALKEMEVNPDWVSQTTDDPDTTGFSAIADWTTGTNYTVGEKFFYDDYLYIVVSDHTSGTFSTDLGNNLIRMLIAANRNNDGYYRSMKYNKTYGWMTTFQLGEYHGGKTRCRGNPAVFYESNVIMSNVTIKRYNSVFTWEPNINYSDYQKNLYTSVVLFRVNKKVKIDGLTVLNYGKCNGTITGITYDISPYITDKRHHLNNITISGEDIGYGINLGFDDLISDDTAFMDFGNISFDIVNGSTNYYYRNAIIMSYPSGWTYDKTWNFAITGRSNEKQVLGGDVIITDNFAVKKNFEPGGENLFVNSSVPINMQASGIDYDTVLVTFYYENTLNSNYLRSYIDLYLFSHVYTSVSNYSGLAEIKIAATGDGTGNSHRIQYDTLLWNPTGGSYMPPSASDVGYWDSDGSYITIYITNTSTSYYQYLWFKVLRSENIDHIEIERKQ